MLKNLDAGMAPQSLNEVFAEQMGLNIAIIVMYIYNLVFLVENCLKIVEFDNLMFVAGSIAPSKSASYSWPISSTKARTIFLRIYGPVVPHHCFPTWSLRATVSF